MVEEINFQYLTPLLLAVFSAGFFYIYRQGKTQRAAYYWSIAYLFGAIAFMADLSRSYTPPIIASLLSNGLFIAVPAFLAAGFAEKYNRKLNLRATWVLGSLTFAALLFYWFGIDSFAGRTVAINTGIGLMFLMSLKLIDTSSRLTVDRLLFVLIFVIGVQIMMRAPLVLFQSGEVLTQDTYNASAFAMSLRFFNTVLSTTLAVILLGASTSEMIAELKRKANTDGLTGLRNRRGFKECSERLIELHKRTSLPVSLIITDVDHFKRINDRFGHPVGDRVLIDVAETLSACCRRTDRVGRWGGEEFCILLPSANLQMASLVAETARAKLEETTRESSAVGEITASFGVAEWQVGESFDELYERADAALFSAKDAGRNAVEAFEATHAFANSRSNEAISA